MYNVHRTAIVPPTKHRRASNARLHLLQIKNEGHLHLTPHIADFPFDPRSFDCPLKVLRRAFWGELASVVMAYLFCFCDFK